MKKYILFIIVFGLMIFGASKANAIVANEKPLTLDEAMSQINLLRQEISELQSKLSLLSGSDTPNIINGIPTIIPVKINRDLSIGTRGEDVRALQWFLQKEGFLPLTAKIDGFYGKITAKAVSDYQEANKIVATKKVDSKTREAVNERISLAVVSGGGDDDLPDGCNSRLGYSAVSGISCGCKNGVESVNGKSCGGGNDDNDTTTEKKRVPRIMYWYGKVNQHTDKNGKWVTDPDGVSGADLEKLAYCKKWFPKTVGYRDYRIEIIDTWHDRGNVGLYTSAKLSYECIQKNTDKEKTEDSSLDDSSSDSDSSSGSSGQSSSGGGSGSSGGSSSDDSSSDDNGDDSSSGSGSGDSDADVGSGESSGDDGVIPRIMYWSGKINQHTDSSGNWVSDPDRAGADIDKLTYCQKWFPDTVSVEDYMVETISTWKDVDNVSYTSAKMSTRCVQGSQVQALIKNIGSMVSKLTASVINASKRAPGCLAGIGFSPVNGLSCSK